MKTKLLLLFTMTLFVFSCSKGGNELSSTLNDLKTIRMGDSFIATDVSQNYNLINEGSNRSYNIAEGNLAGCKISGEVVHKSEFRVDIALTEMDCRGIKFEVNARALDSEKTLGIPKDQITKATGRNTNYIMFMQLTNKHKLFEMVPIKI